MKTSAFSRLLTVGTVLIFFLSVASFDLQASELGNILPFGTPHFSYNQFSQIPTVKMINPTRVAGYRVNAAVVVYQNDSSQDPVANTNTGGGSGSQTTLTSTPQIHIVSPNDYLELPLGSTYLISWNSSQNITSSDHYGVYLALLKPGDPEFIPGSAGVLLGAGDLQYAGNYNWKIGEYQAVTGTMTAPAGSGYRIAAVLYNFTKSEIVSRDESDRPFNITSPLAGSPDLIVDSLSLDPSNPVVNQNFIIKGTIKNIGNADAYIVGANPIQTGGSNFTVSASPSGFGGFLAGVTGIESGAIAPGGIQHFEFNANSSSYHFAEPGTYTVTMNADVNNVIAESNELNNSRAISIVVGSGVSTACSDTDGGFVPNKKGTVCVGSDCVSDTCSTTMGVQFVHEYFCQGTARSSASESCGYGNICYQGACVKADQTPLPFQSRTTTCTDSDGGNNLNVKGVTRGENYQGVYIEAYDKCTSATSDYGADTGDYVAEFYCLPNSGQSFAASNASSWVYPSYRNKCTYGCKDGRCLTASEVTPPSTVCAGPGLRADIYGGPNQVCCVGLVLQGGICNNPAPSQNKTVAVVSPNGGEAYVQGSSIAVSWSGARNWVIIGLVEGSATSATIPSTNSSLPLLGWIKQSNDASGSVTWDGKQVCDLLLTTCWPVKPGQYKIIASSKDLMGNATLWNADANFDLSDASFTLMSKDEKLRVCHLNSAGNYTILDILQDGWDNGHKKHSGDFIKTGEGTCAALAANNGLIPNSGNQDDGPVPVPGLVTTPQTPTQTTQDKKDELIQRLQLRIQKLEHTVTALERQVTQREIDRQTTPNPKLAARLDGQLLLQTQEHGEVWWVLKGLGEKVYLQNGESAFKAMRAFCGGISEKDFKNIGKIGKSHIGECLMRVEANGEAYYINQNGEPLYLQNGSAAYQIMREEALGIKNKDLSTIPTSTLLTETSTNP